MKNYIFTGIAAFVGAILAVVIGFLLVGNQQSADILGASGITRMPNSGMAMKFLVLSATPGTATAVGDGILTASGLGTFTGGLTATGGFTTDRILFGSTGKTTVPTSTATSTLTLTAAQVCDNALIEWTPSLAASTSTLPTATALVADCLTSNGMEKTLRLKNLGDTASTTFILGRLSTGISLYAASTSLANASSTIIGGGWADLYFMRASSTQVDVGVTVFEKNIQ